ncbi:MAG: hypothetical protein GY801_33850 [bacterium]|nr:hypothetical protein [bacterium]
MDYGQLATQITVFLTPFLPYLVLAGETTAKELGEKFSETAAEKAKSLWSKIIGSKPKESSAITDMATTLAKNPNSEIFQAALAEVLSKHLDTSPELVTDLMTMMNEDKAIQKVLVEQASTVNHIVQKLSTRGTQDITVSGQSQAGDITQEQ